MPDSLPPIEDAFAALRTPQSDAAPPQAPASGLPPIEQAFSQLRSPPPSASAFSQGFQGTLGASPPGQDEYLAQSPVGKILDAFGQGAKQGWGTDNIGLSTETSEWLKKVGIFNDVSKGQTSIVRTFNEGLFRPLAAGLDAVGRTLGAVQGGAEAAAAAAGAEVGQPQLGRDVAGAIESFGGLAGSPGAFPHAASLETSRDLGAIGHDEGVYFGTEEPKPGDGPVAQAGLTLPERHAEAQAAPPEAQASEAPATPETPAVAPDVHAVARQIAPEVFQGPKGFDALAQQQDTFRRWITELGDTRDQAATADIDTQIADTQTRLEDATGKRAATYRDRLSDLQDQRQRALDEANKDTPDMARVRQDLLNTQYAMRDLAPQVTAAYREAQSRLPPPEEVAPQNVEAVQAEPSPAPVQPVPETETGNEPGVQGVQPPVSETVAATNEPRIPNAPRSAVNIADDVSQKLQAAGRPQEEADAAAQLVNSIHEARASILGITPEGSYRETAADIQPGKRGRKGEMGRTIINGATKIIRLMGNADASTFIHEVGHERLDQVIKDAADPRATPQLKADVATIRDWLGVKEGEEIPRRADEKFARGFERYVMEGHAPTQGLADVFAKFKDWLTKIYDNVNKLRSPITDDIRDVFDRLVSKRGDETVIAPEREAGKEFADIHEADAEHTPPEKAAGVADNVRSEIDQIAKEKEPALYGKLNPSNEAGRIETENANNPSGGNGPEPVPADAGAPPQSGKIAEGGNEAPSEGGNLGGTASSAGGSAERAATAKADRDFAGNINLKKVLPNVTTEGDARALVRQLAAENMDFSDARFGDAAYALQQQVRASGVLLRETANDAVEAFNKWQQSGSEEDAYAYKVASDRVLLAANVRAELAAGAGRGLAAFREIPDRGPTEDVVAYLQRTTGKTLFQLKEEGDLLNGLDSAEKKAKFLNESRSTLWQRLREGYLALFINNLISGPLTHAAYGVGNAVWSMFKAQATTRAAAGIDAMREWINGQPLEDRVYAAEAAARTYALWKGWRGALPAAQAALKTGQPFMKGAAIIAERAGEEAPHYGVRELAPGAIGNVVNALTLHQLPSRSVTAIHTLFYSGNYEAEIAARAVRSGLKLGLEGDALNTHIADFTAKPPDADVVGAHQESLKMVLMQKPPFDSDLSNLTRFVNNNVILKTAIPFMQIGSNILKEGLLEHSPLGIALPSVRDNLMGRNGAVAQSMQYGKIAVGTMAGTAVMSLAAEGLITGHVSKEEELEGKKAYSIKVGDTYIPYRKFIGPLGPLIAGAADLQQVAGQALFHDQWAKAGQAALLGFSEVVADETWMSGLSNFVNAATHWDTDGTRYLRNLAVDFIPFSIGLGQVARTIDPYSRQVSSFSDAVQNQIPFASENLLPRRNVWGDEIETHHAPNMVAPSSDANDPASHTFEQLNYAPTMPEKTINGVRLSPQQYDDYARIAGRTAHMRINQLVQTPGFQNQMAQEPGKALNTVKDIFRAARAGARQQVMIQSDIRDGQDSIRLQATRAKQAKITGVPATP